MRTVRYILLMITAVSGLSTIVHSEMVKSQIVDNLLQPYLNIQNALAENNLQAAKKYSKGCLDLLTLEFSEVQTMEIINFEIAATRIHKAESLDEARSGLLIASIVIENLISTEGVTGDPPLYVFSCPMAFDNNGGQWIQENQSVKNPYFGSLNPGCGVLEYQISGISTTTGIGKLEHELTPVISAELIKQQGKDYPPVCVVSDEPLVEGEYLEFEFEGHLVRFCCKGCTRDFLDNPKEYMMKLEKLRSGDLAKGENQ